MSKDGVMVFHVRGKHWTIPTRDGEPVLDGLPEEVVAVAELTAARNRGGTVAIAPAPRAKPVVPSTPPEVDDE